jgi:hypothetical protein
MRTTPQPDQLRHEECWDGDHPSELALSCLADGQQDVVEARVREHVDGCGECTLRVGELALESHAVGDALVALRAAEARAATPAHRFPVKTTAIAAALALVCALPALIDGLPRLLPWIFAAPRLVPLLTTSAVAVAHDFGSSPLGRVVSVASAATLCLIGFALARATRAASVRKA